MDSCVSRIRICDRWIRGQLDYQQHRVQVLFALLHCHPHRHRHHVHACDSTESIPKNKKTKRGEGGLMCRLVLILLDYYK